MYVLNIFLTECRRNVILFQNLNWDMKGKLHPVEANCSVRKKIDFEHNSAKDEPKHDNEDSTAGCSKMDISETNENYLEAVCAFNFVLPELEVKSTQYLESDIVAHEDHSYAMKLSDTQSTFTKC